MACGHLPGRRQQEIAGLVAVGLSNSEIAQRLGITVSTVKGTLTEVYFKTETRNRVELTHWVLAHQQAGS